MREGGRRESEKGRGLVCECDLAVKIGGANPRPDEVVQAGHAEPHTEGDSVEEEEDEELVVGVAHTVVDPAGIRQERAASITKIQRR